MPTTVWTEFLASLSVVFDAEAVASFGAPAEERLAAEREAVLCDLSPLAVLRVAGADAEAFLQGQLTNDVAALAVGHSQYSAWCSAKGRVLSNFVVRRSAASTFELLLPHSLIGSIAKRLAMFVLRARVIIDDATPETVRIGLGGPEAARAVAALTDVQPAPHRDVAVDGGTLVALPGRRFVLALDPHHAVPLWEKLQQIARPAGFPVWQWLTIRAGVPVVTPATSDQFVPQMLNWDALEGINFQKGCYAGQEIVARTQYLGRLKERTFLFHVDASPAPAGARLFSASFGDQQCGTVVNASPAPRGGSDMLATAQIAARERGDVRLGGADGPALEGMALPYTLPSPTAAQRGRMA